MASILSSQATAEPLTGFCTFVVFFHARAPYCVVFSRLCDGFSAHVWLCPPCAQLPPWHSALKKPHSSSISRAAAGGPVTCLPSSPISLCARTWKIKFNCCVWCLTSMSSLWKGTRSQFMISWTEERAVVGWGWWRSCCADFDSTWVEWVYLWLYYDCNDRIGWSLTKGLFQVKHMACWLVASWRFFARASSCLIPWETTYATMGVLSMQSESDASPGHAELYVACSAYKFWDYLLPFDTTRCDQCILNLRWVWSSIERCRHKKNGRPKTCSVWPALNPHHSHFTRNWGDIAHAHRLTRNEKENEGKLSSTTKCSRLETKFVTALTPNWVFSSFGLSSFLLPSARKIVSTFCCNRPVWIEQQERSVCAEDTGPWVWSRPVVLHVGDTYVSPLGRPALQPRAA